MYFFNSVRFTQNIYNIRLILRRERKHLNKKEIEEKEESKHERKDLNRFEQKVQRKTYIRLPNYLRTESIQIFRNLR